MRTSRREQKKKDIETLLIEIIAASGAAGTTITSIEAAADFDRHTVVKYLLVLEQRGILSCRIVGKAKLWALNTAPLQSVFAGLFQPKSFIEQVLATVMSSVPQGLVVVDSQYNILYSNGTAQAMRRNARFIYELFGLENPVKLSKLTALLDDAHSAGRVERQLLQVPDEKWYALSIQTFALGEQQAAVVLIDDVTEQKNAQQLIADQASQLAAERRAIDAAAIFAETDLRGVITHANDKFCAISGYSRSELIGKTHAVVNSGYHPKSYWANLWKTIASGKVWQGEIRNKRKDGSYYWVESVIAPVMDARKRPIKYLALRFDVTKYKDEAHAQIKADDAERRTVKPLVRRR